MDRERYGAVAAELDEAVLDEGLASLAANRDRPYYDAAADADAAANYYSVVDVTATGAELLRALQTLLTRTHTQTPRYAPARMVYPWVDLHPDRRLRSIYSGKSFDPEDVIRDDARIEAMRTSRLRDLVAREVAIGPDAFTDELAELDALMPYNCEHVVPAVVLREEGADARRSAPPVHLRVALQQLPKQHTVFRLRRCRRRGDGRLRQI
jgi:hypothetical protein